MATDNPVRQVESAAELERAFDIAGSVFTPPIDHRDRRFERLAAAWPADRELMHVAEHEGAIVGAALGIRLSPDGVLLAMLAVLPQHRGGTGRRLVEKVEEAACRLGVTGIALGAVEESRAFYRRLGYTGRSRMRKSLSGLALARYADPVARKAQLDALRARRAARTN